MNGGFLAVATLLAALGVPGALAAEPMAKVLSVSGIATAQAGAATRILGASDALSPKDVISVGPDSHALIEFSDRTRVTLRPNTVFKVDAYSTEKPESALFGLVRGGFRAVTGYLSKLRPGAVQVATPTATIGIRGTEFDARLCEDDCAQEEARYATAAARSRRVVARVVEVNGAAFAAGKAGAPRRLVPGAMVYAGEAIVTEANGYAVLAFRDGTRITLADGGRLAVKRFDFDEAAPERGGAHLKLASGTAHVWTGRLAKISPDAFRFDTALGPIRPHGTGFSVSGCIGSLCGSASASVGSDGAKASGSVSGGGASIGGSVSIGSGSASGSGRVDLSRANPAGSLEKLVEDAAKDAQEAARNAVADAGKNAADKGTGVIKEVGAVGGDAAKEGIGKTYEAVDRGAKNTAALARFMGESGRAAADLAGKGLQDTAQTVESGLSKALPQVIGATGDASRQVADATKTATKGVQSAANRVETGLSKALPLVIGATGDASRQVADATKRGISAIGGADKTSNEPQANSTSEDVRTGNTTKSANVSASVASNPSGSSNKVVDTVASRATAGASAKAAANVLGTDASKPAGGSNGDDEALAARIAAAEARAEADRAKQKAESLARAAAFQNNEDLNRRVREAKRDADRAAEDAKQAEARANALATQGMDRAADRSGAAAPGMEVQGQANAPPDVSEAPQADADAIAAADLRAAEARAEAARAAEVAREAEAEAASKRQRATQLAEARDRLEAQATQAGQADDEAFRAANEAHGDRTIASMAFREAEQTLAAARKSGNRKAVQVAERVVEARRAAMRKAEAAYDAARNAREDAFARAQSARAAVERATEQVVGAQQAARQAEVRAASKRGEANRAEAAAREAEAAALAARGVDVAQDNDARPKVGKAVGADTSAENRTGIEVTVWDGAVEVGASDGPQMVRKGEKGVLADAGGKATVTVAAAGPEATGAPRPDRVTVDPALFDGKAKDVQAGLYVWVQEGTIILNQGGQTLEVEAGSAAVATPGGVVPLDTVPNFMRFDATPRPTRAGAADYVLPAFRGGDGSIGGCAAK